MSLRHGLVHLNLFITNLQLYIMKILINIAIVIFVVLLFGCSNKNEGKLLEKPNIVLLIAEDVSPELGAYGNEYATTPNIDALASEGVVFDLALTTAPICAPSRSALASGVRHFARNTASAQRNSFSGKVENVA